MFMAQRFFVVLLAFFSFTSLVNAQEVISQDIVLSPGWNIISTPKVLESHQFSAPETSDNFDIYILDASSPTGWVTMSDLEQTEFEPLYGYFVQNKTGVQQFLTLNYDTTLEPNQKLFERTFSAAGWYSIGVANGEYAKEQGDNTIDTNNPSRILSLLEGKYDLVIDFTNAVYRSDSGSVALTDPWKAVSPIDIYYLNDFRETKGYAIYVKEDNASYSGFQNNASSTGGIDSEQFLVNVLDEYVTEETVVKGGSRFEFDIQPTEIDVVLGKFVVKVSTPGATTSEVIDNSIVNLLGQNLPGELVQDKGEYALFEFDVDKRVAITAGQKQKISTSFSFDEDFSDPTNSQEIQFFVEDEEIGMWEIYSGIELIPTDEIGGSAESAVYTIFNYGAIINELYVNAERTSFSDTLRFEVEVDAEFYGGTFNVVDDLQPSYISATNTINGLAYRIEGPEGFESISIVQFNQYVNATRVNLEYQFTFTPTLPGEYTFIVEDVFFVNDDKERIVSVFEDNIDEDDRRARATIQNPADTLTGFADLQQFNLYPADFTSIPVGGRDEVLAISEASFIDGDALIQSLQIQLASIPFEANLWEVFESFSLWVDGKKIDDVQIDSINDFFGAEHDIVQFDDLQLLSLQNEITEFIIAADISSTTPEAGLGIYELQVARFVYQDAESVLTTETEFDDIGQFGGVNFEVEPLVQELVFSLSPSTPDATTLVVEDNQDSVPYTVFVYDISTGDSNTDIEIGSLELEVTVGSSTYFNIVDDARLVIDGWVYDDLVVENGDTQTATLWFDINNQHVIQRGMVDEIELELVFNPLESEYEGVTVVAEANSTNVDATGAEGTDDLSPADLAGSATGETHTLRTGGLLVYLNSESAYVTIGDMPLDDYATFTIELEVTAFGQDAFISTDPVTSISYVLQDGAGSTVTAGTNSAALTSTADESNGYFEIREGETENLTLHVTYMAGVSNTATRLALKSISFADTAIAPTEVQETLPAEDFRTSVITLVN
jgi:hypothetical protein